MVMFIVVLYYTLTFSSECLNHIIYFHMGLSYRYHPLIRGRGPGLFYLLCCVADAHACPFVSDFPRLFICLSVRYFEVSGNACDGDIVMELYPGILQGKEQ